MPPAHVTLVGEQLLPVYLAEDRTNMIVGGIRVAKLLFECLVLSKKAYKRCSSHVVLLDLVVEPSNTVHFTTSHNDIITSL